MARSQPKKRTLAESQATDEGLEVESELSNVAKKIAVALGSDTPVDVDAGAEADTEGLPGVTREVRKKNVSNHKTKKLKSKKKKERKGWGIFSAIASSVSSAVKKIPLHPLTGAHCL